MASSNIRWISAVIDLPDECFGAGKAFWWETTEFRPNLPSWNDPNFAVMQPEPASTTPHLWIQRLWEGEPRVHLDISVGDTVEAADVVRALGGSCEAPLTSWSISSSSGRQSTGHFEVVSAVISLPVTRCITRSWCHSRRH